MTHKPRMRYRNYSYCQYLHISSQTFLHALNLFSSSSEGDVERSFSSLHKAWVLLFQSDILLKDNGKLFSCLTCQAAEQERRDEGNEEQEVPLNFTCLEPSHKKDSKIYALEKALNEISKGGIKEVPILSELSNGYIFSEGTGLFNTINTKNTFYDNLRFIRDLRNIDQHSYSSPSNKQFGIIVDMTQQYVVANTINYMETYRALWTERIPCRPNKDTDLCSCRMLEDPYSLSRQIFFPITYSSVMSPFMDKTVKEYDEYIENKLATLNTTLAKNQSSLKNANADIRAIETRLSDITLEQTERIRLQKSKSGKEKGLLSLEQQVKQKSDEIVRVQKSSSFYKSQMQANSSSLRYELSSYISKYRPNSYEDYRLINPVATVFPEDATRRLNQQMDTDAQHYQKAILFKEHMNVFIYSNLNAIVEALELRFAIKTNSQKLKSIKNELDNYGEFYYGKYFGEDRFTENFLLFAHNHLTENRFLTG